MKLALIFLLFVTSVAAAPKATLDAAEAFNKAVDAELTKTGVEKGSRERLGAIRVEMEKIRRLVASIEAKWGFSRRASTSKEIIEANRLSTLSGLRTLAESSGALLARFREVVLESKLEQVEALFTSLQRAISEYEKELKDGRYP
jgi:hypothetical protein